MAPGVKVADEAGQAVLELDATAVGPPVVDDEDAEIGERPLEDAAAAVHAVQAPEARRQGRRRALDRSCSPGGALRARSPGAKMEGKHLEPRPARPKSTSTGGQGKAVGY